MDLSHPILFYLAGIPVRVTVVYTWITMGSSWALC